MVSLIVKYLFLTTSLIVTFYYHSHLATFIGQSRLFWCLQLSSLVDLTTPAIVVIQDAHSLTQLRQKHLPIALTLQCTSVHNVTQCAHCALVDGATPASGASLTRLRQNHLLTTLTQSRPSTENSPLHIFCLPVKDCHLGTLN